MTQPYFYSVANMTGSGLMADLFEVEDPYETPAAKIVDGLLALGCTPIVDSMQREPFPQFGHTHQVQRGDQTFLVAISRDAELIGVQEVRLDPYPPK